MEATAITFSCILFAAALALIGFRLVASPCCSFLGLLVLSLAKTPEGYPLLPFSSGLIFGWLCVTVLVTVITLIQPEAVKNTNRGVWYMTGGAITGMVIGLMGIFMSSSVNALYAIMIIATAAGTFFGFLVYAQTPSGRGVRATSGRFFGYLSAKGFPIAITVMQGGAVLALLMTMHYYSII